MNMKKLFRMLLVLMLALSLVSLVSCGDDEPEEPEKEEGGYEDIFPDFGEGVEGPIIPYE